MRLGVVRGFARYLHEVHPRVEVPPADVLPDRSRRAVPYLYTDEQIQALMAATSTLRTAHKTATFRTLFGLLLVTACGSGRRSHWTAPTSTPTSAHSSSATGSSGNPASCRCTRPRPRADALSTSPGSPPTGRTDRGAADLDRRHKAVDRRCADRLSKVARPSGDPAAIGCVPAKAARLPPQLCCPHAAGRIPHRRRRSHPEDRSAVHLPRSRGSRQDVLVSRGRARADGARRRALGAAPRGPGQ